MKEQTFTLPELGIEVVLGKYAGQAHGSAWLRQEGTIVLATVVSATARDFPGFLPLTVDYREQSSAAGKIPGGYFKREGRPSDDEILTARLIDRAIRPLFPENYFDNVQLLCTVYSVDKEHVPYTLALLAASIALMTSKIPFMGPVGVAEVAKINGALVVNPTYSQLESSEALIVVAGNSEGINMVEGNAAEISEDELITALFMAHAVIKKQVQWQELIAAQYKQGPVPEAEERFGWKVWKQFVENMLTPERVKPLFTADKVARDTAQKQLKADLLQECIAAKPDEQLPITLLEHLFDKILAEVITELCFELDKRIDGRAFEQVRAISTEVSLLPSAHGSALFTRGRTQALVSVTLGGGQDAAKVDSLMGATISKKFMLHYNFPPFSVGEVRPNRGPGRREIGHGFLAASAIERMLPDAEQFGYTIRIVADMLESDGSTSMATVCGSVMGLMDAGVPLKKMVSGVAMGLLRDSKGALRVLTDISGIEDAFGLMDFKVAGTESGITAIQMDIKYKGGLERVVFERALEAARKGRAHILQEMQKVMKAPRATLSSLVPQVVSFRVATDKIGAIIGTGGKVIKEITEKTGASIDIEDDGRVNIYGQPGEKFDLAVLWTKTRGGLIERGMRYHGTIKRIVEDLGIFVEIAPGQDGLVHISTIPRSEQQQVFKTIKVGDPLTVEVMDYDPSNGRIRLMRAQ